MRAHLAGTDADCSQIGTWCDRLAQHQALRGRLADDEAEAAAAEVEILDTVAAESGSRVSISDRLVELLATAEEEVVVMNPYIVLTERGLNVLKDLSARGVRVRLTQALFHETWPELMAQAPTLEITVVNENRLMHAKAAVIDQKVALVGSHNLDYLSSDVNGEVGAVVRSPAIAGAVRRHIVSWIDGERGNVVHYTIKRDASGRVLRETDGPLQGRVVVDVGVASHTAPEMVQKIGAMQVVLRARKLLPRYQKLL
jgi:phosphatidylserine/phosphatidylglycerophosphate/cardiolipin synthase-like enzyme